MICELCGGHNDVREGVAIITDGNERFEGALCLDCREGRMLCPICDLIIPGHKLECPAG